MKNAYTILTYYNAAQLSLTGQQQKYYTLLITLGFFNNVANRSISFL